MEYRFVLEYSGLSELISVPSDMYLDRFISTVCECFRLDSAAYIEKFLEEDCTMVRYSLGAKDINASNVKLKDILDIGDEMVLVSGFESVNIRLKGISFFRKGELYEV